MLRGRTILIMLVVALVAFAGGVWADNALSSRQARRLIANVGDLNLDPEHIHIRRINTGLGGRAVVEALVQTGFELAHQNGQWAVVRVRLGDRQWDSIEFITAAITHEKIRRTSADLRVLAQAMAAYHRDHHRYPAAANFAALVDMLVPQYLGRIIREDYWHRAYVYQPTPNGYQVVSLGADGQLATADDLRLENGHLRVPTTE
ncbi:MAG: type II secretion system protein GspG [Acidobacteriota bacterium]|nr:type II secretion system protein GspG [Blastocatellia bacterium]MDW8241222.1 type II secretion system protein GspG [Acidobacteriota bacterium]